MYPVPIHLTDMRSNLKFIISFPLNTVMGHVHPLTFMLKHKHHCNIRSVVEKSTLKPEKFFRTETDFSYFHLPAFDFLLWVAKILKCGKLIFHFSTF